MENTYIKRRIFNEGRLRIVYEIFLKRHIIRQSANFYTYYLRKQNMNAKFIMFDKTISECGQFKSSNYIANKDSFL